MVALLSCTYSSALCISRHLVTGCEEEYWYFQVRGLNESLPIFCFVLGDWLLRHPVLSYGSGEKAFNTAWPKYRFTLKWHEKNLKSATADHSF